MSMFDNNGSEFFIMLPTKEGKAWREEKHKAVLMIADAIDEGVLPGEISWPRP